MITILDLIFLFLLISIAAIWGYAIYDVTRTKFKSKNNKIIWTVLIYCMPLSAIFYFLYKKDII